MNALVDTNIVLDVMLDRKPFSKDSALVLAAVETSRCRGFLCAEVMTSIHYIARRSIGTKESLNRITDLMSVFEIAPVNRAVLDSALRMNFSDFEDAVLHEAALQVGADCIVTRNVQDFRRAKIIVYTPAQFTKALNEG